MDDSSPLPCLLSVVLGAEVPAPVRACGCKACDFERRVGEEAGRAKQEWLELVTDLGGEG